MGQEEGGPAENTVTSTQPSWETGQRDLTSGKGAPSPESPDQSQFRTFQEEITVFSIGII